MRGVARCPCCGGKAVAIRVEEVLGAATAIAWCESCYVCLAIIEFAPDPAEAEAVLRDAISRWRPRADGLLNLVTDVPGGESCMGWVCIDCHKIVDEHELICAACAKARLHVDPVKTSRDRAVRRAKGKKFAQNPCGSCGAVNWKVSRHGDVACMTCVVNNMR